MQQHNYVAEKLKEKEELKLQKEALSKEVEDSLSKLLVRLERVILNATISSTKLAKDGKAMGAACKMLNKEAEKIKKELNSLFVELRQGNLEVVEAILGYLESTNTWISHVAVNLEIIAARNSVEQRKIVKESAEELKSIKQEADAVICAIRKKVAS